MMKYIAGLILAFLTTIPGPAHVGPGERETFEPSLSDLALLKDWTVFNRIPHPLVDGPKNGIRFDERKGNGMAWFPEIDFADGAIEFDVRGRNVPQKSFVGLAFHGVNERFYDAIYFRPFNFRAADSLGRSHAVQYISPPEHGWKSLREQHPGEYENALVSPPDPDSWFHVRVVLAGQRVSVYVEGRSEPCLIVNQLSNRRSGWVGLWVGDDSGGAFANLRITPAGY